MSRSGIGRSTCLAIVAAAMLAPGAEAALVNLGPGSFTPMAPVIEFDEVPLGTTNPSFTFNGIPGLGDVTVTFGGHFLGQAAGGGFPVTLTDTTPTGSLALDPAAPETRTVNDAAPGATSPVLSGAPTFNGPISVLFSVPVAAVGLKGGFFDADHSTTIEAFDTDGNSLGAITNSMTGFEFYGLKDSSGLSLIRGISFYITGDEPAGFQIDDLTFGSAQQIVVATPAPAGMLLVALGAGIAAVLGLARGRKA
jgi:hypothetical protein